MCVTCRYADGTEMREQSLHMQEAGDTAAPPLTGPDTWSARADTGRELREQRRAKQPPPPPTSKGKVTLLCF